MALRPFVTDGSEPAHYTAENGVIVAEEPEFSPAVVEDFEHNDRDGNYTFYQSDPDDVAAAEDCFEITPTAAYEGSYGLDIEDSGTPFGTSTLGIASNDLSGFERGYEYELKFNVAPDDTRFRFHFMTSGTDLDTADSYRVMTRDDGFLQLRHYDAGSLEEQWFESVDGAAIENQWNTLRISLGANGTDVTTLDDTDTVVNTVSVADTTLSGPGGWGFTYNDNNAEGDTYVDEIVETAQL